MAVTCVRLSFMCESILTSLPILVEFPVFRVSAARTLHIEHWQFQFSKFMEIIYITVPNVMEITLADIFTSNFLKLTIKNLFQLLSK